LTVMLRRSVDDARALGAAMAVGAGMGEAPAYRDALRQIGAYLAKRVVLDAATQVVAVGRPGRRMAEGATTAWGPVDALGATIAADGQLQVTWNRDRPRGDLPVAVLMPTIRSGLVLQLLLSDMARDGTAPVTVLAAQASGGAIDPLRRAHPYLEVITPELVDLYPPGTSRPGWIRRDQPHQ